METEHSLQEPLTWLTSICQVLGRGGGYASALRNGAGKYHRYTDGSGACWLTASHRRRANNKIYYVMIGLSYYFQASPKEEIIVREELCDA